MSVAESIKKVNRGVNGIKEAEVLNTTKVNVSEERWRWTAAATNNQTEQALAMILVFWFFVVDSCCCCSKRFFFNIFFMALCVSRSRLGMGSAVSVKIGSK